MAKKYRVLIPIDKPQAARELITLGAAVARHYRGEAIALNILLRSRQEMCQMSSREVDTLLDEHNQLLKEYCRHTRELGITVTPATVLSQWVQETILHEARTRGANMVIMGWNKPPQTPGAVMGSILDKVASQAPADVAVFRNRGLQDRKVLLSTAGGPESHLGAQIAAALQNTWGAAVTLLHLVKTKEEMDKGRQILEEFSDRYRLKARRIIKTRENFTAGILEESKFHNLIIVGGSRVGIFSRMFSRTIPDKVVEQAESSVLITHRHGTLPFMTRFFGSRRP